MRGVGLSEVGVEVGAGKLFAIPLVIEDPLLTELGRKMTRDGFDTGAVFPGEGERDIEALATNRPVAGHAPNSVSPMIANNPGRVIGKLGSKLRDRVVVMP